MAARPSFCASSRDLTTTPSAIAKQRVALLRRFKELPQRAIGELICSCSNASVQRAETRCGVWDATAQSCTSPARAAAPLGKFARGDRGSPRWPGDRPRTRDRARGALHHYGPASAGWLITRAKFSAVRARKQRGQCRTVDFGRRSGLAKLCEEIQSHLANARDASPAGRRSARRAALG